MNDRGRALLGVAREAVAFHLAGRDYTAPCVVDQIAGAFVTVTNADGSLRGCIGHIEPVRAHLAAEIADIAVAAATRDPRFAPVTAAELNDVAYSISVLGPAERVDPDERLDPRRYGVVVSREGRRGVLLPGLPGVRTVAQQLAIARRKAGIPPGVPIVVHRFEVEKHAEVV